MQHRGREGRGISTFGSIQKGATTGGSNPEIVSDFHDRSIFYPVFLSASGS